MAVQELTTRPAEFGWRSIPVVVRAAIWVWALLTLISLVVSVVAGLVTAGLFLLGM